MRSIDKFQFTEELKAKSGTKVITLRTDKQKGMMDGYKLYLEPAKSIKNNSWVGVKDVLSREQTESGVYYPRPAYFDSVNNRYHEATRLTLVDGYQFNLDNPVDAANWAWVVLTDYVTLFREDT